MNQEIAQHLLTPPGRALLAEADALLQARAETLTALTRLRRSAAPDLAAAAWEMAELRRRGQAKFGPQASEMYFAREALEQASGRGTADYHAARFQSAGAATIADLGGGIGGDALAFARAGMAVTLSERDPVRALFAEENARVWGFAGQITVQQEDVTTAALSADAAWLDPARRRDSRRVSSPEDYAPPLSWLTELAARGIHSIGVKLSPAVDHVLAGHFEAEMEFLSEGGECREALLWLGGAQSGDRLRATVLTPRGPHSLTGEEDAAGQPCAASGRYLYEPDPAVIRAHLVRTLARQLDAAPVDPQIAYLLGDRLVSTPFADAYEVLDRFPYGKKRLQEALTARRVGHVIIKKRGFPQEPDEMRKLLKLRGTEEMIVVLARIGKGHEVFCADFRRRILFLQPRRNSRPQRRNLGTKETIAMSFPQSRLFLSLALSLLWPTTAFAQMPPAPAQADAQQVQLKVYFVTVSAADLDKSGVMFDRVPSESSTVDAEPTTLFLQYAVGDYAAQLLQMLLHTPGKAVQAPLMTTPNNVAATIQVATQIPDQKAGFLLLQSSLAITPRINSDGSVTLHVALKTLDATDTPAAGASAEASAEPLAAILRTVRSGDVIAIAGLPFSAGRPKSDQKLLVFVTPTIIGTSIPKADAGQPELPSPPVWGTPSTTGRTVSIDVFNANLRSVVAMLERQLGLKASVQDSDSAYKPVYVHLSGAPFPEALGAIARSAGAQIIRDENGVYVFSPLPGAARTPVTAAPVTGGSSVTVTP